MSRLVIDASVAVKWAVREADSDLALALRARHAFIAPDLLNAECANVVWKKFGRDEITADQAEQAAAVVARSGISLFPSGPLMQSAVRLAVAIGRPAYDCFYLALSQVEGAPFVTVDARLKAKLAGTGFQVISLLDAAAMS